ncbi:MAG: response regulator [Leptolyngbyaceae cyanobacterium MAG.088]|nr:response regulator [Leptolyngbyaceae cyanobacterium MAG.088]
MKYKPIILSVAAGSILIWVGLIAKGHSGRTGNHSLYQNYLSKQLQNDLNVNQAIIDNQQALQPSYEPLVQELNQSTELQDKLGNFPGFLSNLQIRQLQKALDDSNQILAQKADLAEQFKAKNSLVKKSLSALLTITNDINGENRSSIGGQTSGIVIELLNLVILYAVSSDQTLVSDIERQITEVETLRDSGYISDRTSDNLSVRNNIDTILENTRVILDNKPQADQITQSLLALPTTQQLQTLSKTYNDAYQSAQGKARLFQLAATLWGIGSVGVAAYVILERRQSRKVEKITNFLSESIDDAFIDIDSQWKITYANARAAKDLDKSPDELAGQVLWSIMPVELGKDKEQYYHEARNQQTLVTFETRFAPKARWLEFRLTPTPEGISIFWQDISSRKKAEVQLALSLEANDEALKKAYEAQKKAEAERLKAEKANQTKSEFLANMSHELRTPLNAIIGYSEMLEEDAEDLEQEDFIPELQKIQGAGKHLLGLINDVLDLSKVEAGHMEMYLETFSITPLVQDVASTMQPVIDKNNNTLKIQHDNDIEEMHADEVKVRQSLFNLLSNANKFTQGGTITLSINAENSSHGRWINFKIQDTGIGMLPEQLQKIFNAFAQADSSTTRKYGGTGLGLTITKRFVQMMGGTVNVESDVGQGTTFTIRIPQTVTKTVLPSEPSAPKIPEDLTINAHKSDEKQVKSVPEQSISSLITAPGSECILVVDEDDDNCKFIWKSLVSQGYFVVLTHNKRKGLKMADQLLPDIILLDSIMLRNDDYDVFEALEANSTLANIPVIVQTKLPDKKVSYSLGKIDNLPKENNLQKLLTALNTYHQKQSDNANFDNNNTPNSHKQENSSLPV